MTVPSSAVAPAVSPFRTSLLGLVLLAQLTHQQIVDTGQPWDKSPLIPTNLVYEHRDIHNRGNGNFSFTSSVEKGANSEPTYSSDEKEAEVDENYDYLNEEEEELIEQPEEQEEDPPLIRNRETYVVQSISKEKIINETTVFHSGETNGTDYPEYHYYDYDYDNDTNFESEEPSLSHDEDKKEAAPKEEDYIEESSVSAEDENVKENTTSSDNSILIGEAIVSVVTTKSVVNGTFSVPVTPMPQTTEQLDSPQSQSPISPAPETSSLSPVTEPITSTTEDSDKVLASVQTVRSISGARFLPFPGIDPLQYSNVESTSPKSKIFSSSSERSTESIIDKLDRFQSELSSGILATNLASSGNNIQIDSINLTKQTQNGSKLGTTLRTPVINKFVPKRYNDRRLNKTTTTTPSYTKISINEDTNSKTSTENSEENVQSETVESSTAKPTTEAISLAKRKFGNITVAVQDISAFLPPGYKLKQETSTEKSLLSEILSKSQVDISAFLPPGYKKDNNQKSITATTQPVTQTVPIKFKSSTTSSSLSPTLTTTEKTTNSSSKKVTSIQDLFAKTEVDLSALLPKDYKQRFKIPEVKTTKRPSEDKVNRSETISSTTEQISTTKASGSIKLVFPSRPGGRKGIAPKITTPASPKGEGPGQVTPKIQKGWPTRATTEFTGWPKPSTTPISIEKLLEAARTATVSTLSNTSVTLSTVSVSTTSTTTTTTTTPRPTTPGICDDECKVAGTIRLVGNATWVPELLDRNTLEWQDLADKIEKEMNIVFSKSPILKKWFKEVKIDSFSQGSILVDYFIELVDVQKPVDTQQIKRIFHDSLHAYNVNRYNDASSNSSIKLGPFTIDPKFTDFIVIPRVSPPQYIEHDKLIPQWVIAVIVIGVGGLLFIIVFGVSVLANRQSGSKLKPSMSAMYEEEISKNTMHTSSSAPSVQRSNDYPKSNTNSMWTDTTPTWTHDKTMESNSNKVLMDVSIPFEEEKRYNLYDSWRSEWNGYYYNQSQTSSRYPRYDSTLNLSRHHADYDTNF